MTTGSSGGGDGTDGGGDPAAPGTGTADHARLQLDGEVTRERLRAACEALVAQGPVARLLVDLRGVAGPRPDSARIQLACHLVVYFFDAKVALLARQESINHVTEGVAARAGMALEQFWREDTAVAWLRAG